jgi:hypothetical protein
LGSPGAAASPTPEAFAPGRTLPPGTVLWPESVIGSTISLAVLDNEIKRAGADLIVAAEQRDMQLFLSASEGLQRLAGRAIPNANRLLTWEDTRATGAAYLPVLCALERAAGELATALRAGDGDGVTAASGLLATAIQEYRDVRADLVDLAEVALIMRRGLLVQ